MFLDRRGNRAILLDTDQLYRGCQYPGKAGEESVAELVKTIGLDRDAPGLGVRQMRPAGQGRGQEQEQAAAAQSAGSGAEAVGIEAGVGVIDQIIDFLAK